MPAAFWNDFLEYAPQGTRAIAGTSVGQDASLFGGINPELDTTETGMTPSGVPTAYGFNSKMSFPSLGADTDDQTAGDAYMRNMVKSRMASAERMAASDPEGAGIAFADIDTMTRGYRGLTSTGWNAREAAHTVGVAGAVFGSYANVEDNARYIKRFADNRGVDIASAGHELDSYRKNFGAMYATVYGLTKAVSPDSAHAENISNDFSDIVGALARVEDSYNWQFNKATYSDVMRKSARIAADLAVSGHSVADIGAENVVRYALMKNGSLRDGKLSDNPVAQILDAQAKDRAVISLFGDGAVDNVQQPFRSGTDAKGRPTDAGDFGLSRAIRQSFYNHRVRNACGGLGANDFGDTSVLRDDIMGSLKAFSTSSASVSDETYGAFADAIVDSVRQGKPTAVIEIAKALAPALPQDQAEALGRWSHSLFMESAEGQRRLEECVAPMIAAYASQGGLGMRDPLVTAFSSRVFGLARKRFLANRTAADMDEMTREMSDGQIWDGIKQEFGEYTGVFGKIAQNKRTLDAAKAAETTAARLAAQENQ